MKKYDVIVVGGGFAGVAAAIAASRMGAEVLIAEKNSSLGGAAASNLVNPFMRTATKINGENCELSQGIFTEICDELKKFDAIAKNRMEFNEEYLKLILNRMIKKEGVDLLYQVRLYDVVKENDSIKSIKLACVGGSMEISADCFIDATGDGELAFLSACPYQLGRKEDELCQPMTLNFNVIDVDVDGFFKELKDINEIWKKYQSEGKIKNPRENILVMRTTIDRVMHFNSTRIVKRNPTDPFDLTESEIEAREQVFEIMDFLKENSKSFKNAKLISTASQIGVRESRMIKGDYTLTADDIINGTLFEDSIAAGNYEIDVHNPEGTGTYLYYLPEGKYYTIPYRSLLPQGVKNLIAAGRCISSDHEAQASYRIMPTVCCIGQAAGAASALCLKKDCNFRNIDIKELQKILRDSNAFLGL